MDQGTGAGAASAYFSIGTDIFCMCLHVEALCVCVCVSGHVKLDQTLMSAMWLGQQAVFQHLPLFLHALVLCQVCERRQPFNNVICVSSVLKLLGWHEIFNQAVKSVFLPYLLST